MDSVEYISSEEAQEKIFELREELAVMCLQLALAREALQSSQAFVESSANAKLLSGWGDQLDKAEAALAAIDDAKLLEGLVLCDAEPRAWSWENKNVKGNWYLTWREPEDGFNKTPLYARRKP
jgi:DnaJ-domain-containing protein 1